MGRDKVRSILFAVETARMARELCELIEWENIGYCVVGQASNGLQAMEMTAGLHPDILIMDVHLPEYNGIEVLRRVRVFCPHLPVILISSSAEFIYAQQALRYGAQDILVRPIERADILRCLYQIDCSSGPINRPAAVGEKHIALWSSRLSRSAKFADGVRKLILCANTHLALEEKNCLLFQDGPQWIWAAAVEEEEELSFSGQLEQYQVRVGLSGGFFSCQDLKIALRQAQIAACPFWGQEPAVVRECGSMNYEALRLLSQLWGLLHQCNLQQYSWHQFWVMYDILLTTLQTLKVDFAQVIIIYNSLVAMARSIHDHAGMKLEYLSLDNIDALAMRGGTLNQMLMEARRDIQRSLKDGFFVSTDYPAGELTEKILTYLCTHFCDEDISVESLAARFFISPAYFGQVFKQTYGISITEHIHRKRMDYAEYLLTHEDISIKDVSRRVGFTDHYYFSKLFKKYKQITLDSVYTG